MEEEARDQSTEAFADPIGELDCANHPHSAIVLLRSTHVDRFWMY